MFAKSYFALGALAVGIYSTTIAMGWEFGSSKVSKTPPTQRKYASSTHRSHRSHGGFWGSSSFGGGK